MAFFVLLVFGMPLFLYALMKWNEMIYAGKDLPPGEMGWPFFGMTTTFLKQGPDFMKIQKARYGSFFKSHILGSPTIISLDPEVNRHILMNEGKGFSPAYPQAMTNIVGASNISAVQGSDHRRIRSLLLSYIGVSVLKDTGISMLDSFMRSFLDGWDGKSIDLQEKTIEMAFLISFHQIVNTESQEFCVAFKREFDKLVLGTLSLPFNIPGTSYHYAIQGRKKAIKMLDEVEEKRKKGSENIHGDILGCMMRNDDPRHKYLSADEKIDQIITILYSGYETVSKTTMMAIKYLYDHPKALQQIREEHFKIQQEKNPEDPLDWNHYKSMKFTRAVIFETLRLATIVNGVLRRTTQDMKLNGYTVPKGWKIYVYNREHNYDPFFYPDPFSFNPWRWMDEERSLERHEYLLIFGAGIRLCPGKELGMAKISVFIHYFLTRYRWEVAGSNSGILRFPRVEAPNGLHINVEKF